MSDVIRTFRVAPYQRPQAAKANPFKLLPNTRLESPTEVPEVVVEGVPPLNIKKPLKRGET